MSQKSFSFKNGTLVPTYTSLFIDIVILHSLFLIKYVIITKKMFYLVTSL
uniref:Uncharacterized protein n=1 Tax=Lepeophtheirus salmonis TaxID=72036 RepID=A0A0K2V3M3_LEPSM